MRFTFHFLIAACVLTLIGAQGMDANSAEADNETPQQVFDDMRAGFHADKAAGLHVRYQFEISGPAGGEWWIEVSDGKCKISRGRISNPDVTFIVSDKDWVALSNDTLSGWWAYVSGRLKMRGDQNLARKLGEMFP